MGLATLAAGIVYLYQQSVCILWPLDGAAFTVLGRLSSSPLGACSCTSPGTTESPVAWEVPWPCALLDIVNEKGRVVRAKFDEDQRARVKVDERKDCMVARFHSGSLRFMYERG